jgi:hypothetical protein
MAKKISIAVGGLILIIVLSISGICIYNLVKEREENKNNKEVIETVVTQLFTCPNNELTELYRNMYRQMTEATTKSEEERKKEPNYSSLIEDELKKVYGPYFTEQGYEEFKMRFIINHYVYSTAVNYTVTVDRITIKRSESIPTNYSFEADIQYGPKGGSMTDIQIEGSAQFYELSYIQFRDPTLYRELRDKGPSF